MEAAIELIDVFASRRAVIVAFVALAIALPAAARAQDDVLSANVPSPDAPSSDDDRFIALSADARAQLSLEGFRAYIERTRESDRTLYTLLDPPLHELESRETTADAIFWIGTALSLAALIAAIPVYTEYGADTSVPLIAGGAGAFLITLIVQAIVRPGRGDLVRLIDLHDEHLGRR